MMKISSFLTIALLAIAGPAFAQSACPTDGSCPADVGACLAESCPCSAPGNAPAWKNHGQYVKCVVHLRNDLRKAGCLDDDAKRTIAKCAAKSTCGKKESFTRCCFYDTSGVCSDTVADGVPAGTCSNDAAIACDTSTDCITVTSGPKLSSSAENCTDRGGVDIGDGSVCGGCPLPPPAN
jgi:hypothetical protein